jgi:hypothetical protein
MCRAGLTLPQYILPSGKYTARRSEQPPAVLRLSLTPQQSLNQLNGQAKGMNKSYGLY